ncbi:MAG: LysR family transcriptional regulator [Bryobacterales bacterium]|jgi:DNA-binding transcriptional LysR family regulator|nr:LysR family transcriptional regulator [Bryobacterales bacterium]
MSITELDLRRLRYFVAVAEELHFGRAAERLHISQPPLSQQIKALEVDLGVRLLERTRRRVALTAPGQVLLEEARDLLRQAGRAVGAVRRAARGESGRLSIGFVPTADCTRFPEMVREYRRRFPDVELDLRTLHTGPQVDALRDGRLHLGFLRAPVDCQGLAIECFLRETLVVALPADHALAAVDAVALEALADEPLILFPRAVSPEFHDLILGLGRRAGIPFRLGPESDSTQTTLGLVAAGVGVSLLPASILTISRRGVVYRELAGAKPLIEMVVAYDRHALRPPAGRFLEIVRSMADLHPHDRKTDLQ